jgi:heme A synthase
MQVTRGFQRFAWGVAGYTLLVILWGYFLRISESGDGCGTDWPLCHGAVLPEGAGFSTLVELSHRVTSGLVLLLVAGLAIFAFRAFPKGHAVRFGAGLSLLLTVSESLFGAVLVVLGWVAQDISLGRILIRPVHVTNTFALMAALVLTAWWAARGVGSVPWRGISGGFWNRRWLPALGVLSLAWTGAWTGLAVTAFPADSLSEGMGQYLDAEHLLIYLRMVHPLVSLGVIWLVVHHAFRAWSGARAQDDRAVLRLAAAAGALASVQMLAGPATIVLGSPVGMRLVHLLLADLLWVVVIVLASAQMEAGHREARAPNAGRHSGMNEVSPSSDRTKAARSSAA